MRTNYFIKMSDEELEKYYHQHISFECKKEISADFKTLIDTYANEVGEKAGYPILANDLLHVIAKRWMEQNKVLKDFKWMINR